MCRVVSGKLIKHSSIKECFSPDNIKLNNEGLKLDFDTGP